MSHSKDHKQTTAATLQYKPRLDAVPHKLTIRKPITYFSKYSYNLLILRANVYLLKYFENFQDSTS
jgi:hypothetical protein